MAKLDDDFQLPDNEDIDAPLHNEIEKLKIKELHPQFWKTVARTYDKDLGVVCITQTTTRPCAGATYQKEIVLTNFGIAVSIIRLDGQKISEVEEEIIPGEKKKVLIYQAINSGR